MGSGLGFPRGYAAALKLPGEQPWRAAWDDLDKYVKDKPDNPNNRFGVGAGINRRLTDVHGHVLKEMIS